MFYSTRYIQVNALIRNAVIYQLKKHAPNSLEVGLCNEQSF